MFVEVEGVGVTPITLFLFQRLHEEPAAHVGGDGVGGAGGLKIEVT